VPDSITQAFPAADKTRSFTADGGAGDGVIELENSRSCDRRGKHRCAPQSNQAHALKATRNSFS